MQMNILQQEDLIKGMPDEPLMQEAKFPTGQVPQYLVISEIQRRKDMRDRFASEQEQPQGTVSEQIVAGASPQQGIAALPPQMPPVAAMSPVLPPMPPAPMQVPPAEIAPPMASTPLMPETMAAGGGMMPYRRMAGGGIIPPNALVEDASKFSQDSLYDVDPSQMAMANPANMGIATVLPMAEGGVVRMQEGESVPYEIPLSFGRTVSSEDVPEWYRKNREAGREEMLDLESRFTDEEGNIDRAGLHKYLGIRSLEPIAATLTGGLFRAPKFLTKTVAPKVSQTFKKVERTIEEGLLPDIVANFFKNNPKLLLRGVGGAGLAATPIVERFSNTGDVIRQVEVEQKNEKNKANERESNMVAAMNFINQHNRGKSSGGVVKFQSGGTVDAYDMSPEEIASELKRLEEEGVEVPPDISNAFSDVSLGEIPTGGPLRIDPRLKNQVIDVALGEAEITDPAPDPSDSEPDDKSVVPEGVPEGVPLSPGANQQQNYSQSLIDMIAQRSSNIEGLLERQKELPLPDYEALKASITEGVDDDATTSILMSIAKSIAEGKGLAGADISPAQEIKQKAKDAMNALTLAESRGASEREIAAFDKELDTQIALLGAIPSPPNPLTGMTQLQKLQLYRDSLPEGSLDRVEVENQISKITDPTIQNILSDLLVLQGGIESYDPVTRNITTKYGMDALNPGQQEQWNNAKQIGALDQFINQTLSESLETA